MNPKLVSSLVSGGYTIALTACAICLIWILKALIFFHLSVLILTLLTPGLAVTAVVYLGWDDWANSPRIKILLTDEDYDD